MQGGIASGKSTVTGLLAARGAEPLDCDAFAHAALEEPAVRAQVRERFGQQVEGPGGALDRKAIAAIVFRDPEALRWLEELLHPRVGERVRAALEAARVPPGRARRVVVIDAAVADKMQMVEGGYDLVLFVDASLDVRRRRAAGRGWEPGELDRREAQQAPLDAKRRAADGVVPNDGDLAETESHVERFWAQHVEPRR